MRKVIQYIIHGFIWLMLILTGSIFTLFLLIQIPDIQTFIVREIKTRVLKKQADAVEIGRIEIILPSTFRVEQVLIKEQDNDTIVHVGQLTAYLNLFSLVNKKVDLTSLEIRNFEGNLVKMEKENRFNFSYLIEHFSKSPAPEDTMTKQNKKSWKFDINRISLVNIKFSYRDQVTGNSIQTGVGDLLLRMKGLDLENKEIIAREIKMQNSAVKVITVSDTESEGNGNMEFDIRLTDQVTIRESTVNIFNKISGQEILVSSGEITVTADSMHLPTRYIGMDKINMKGADVTIKGSKNSDTIPEDNEVESDKGFGWIIEANDLSLNDNYFRMNMGEPTPGQFNANHFDLHLHENNLENINISKDLMAVEINEFSFAEEISGARVEHLNAILSYATGKFDADTIVLSTPGSNISASAHARFAPEQLQDTIPVFEDLEIIMANSNIRLTELFIFAPSLENITVVDSLPEVLKINAMLTGNRDTLHVNAFQLNVPEKMNINTTALIAGYTQPKKAYYNVEISELSARAASVKNWISDTLFPREINLPPSVSARGQFKGYFSSFTSDLNINSSFGSVDIDTKYDTPRDSSIYDVSVDMENIQPGKFHASLADLDSITLQLTYSGKTDSIYKPSGKLELNMNSVSYKEVMYHDLQANGYLSTEKFDGNVNLDNDYIAFNYSGLIDWGDTVPNLNFNLNLKGADLKRMKLTPQDIRIAGNISTRIKGDKLENINGNAQFNQVRIVKNEDLVDLEPIEIEINNKPEETALVVNSGIADARYSGSVKVTEIPMVFTEYLNTYAGLEKSEIKKPDIPRHFMAEATIKNPVVLERLIEPLKHVSEGAKLKAKYDSEKPVFNIELTLPAIDFKGNQFDSLTLVAETEQSSIHYDFALHEYKNGNILIPTAFLNGELSKDSLSSTVEILNKEKKNLLYMAFDLKNTARGHQFQIKPDSLFLKQTQWKIPENNRLMIVDSLLFARNMKINAGKQEIHLTTIHDSINHTHLQALSFTNFEIFNVTNIFLEQAYQITGELHGNLKTGTSRNHSHLSSDIQLTNFSINEHKLFDLESEIKQSEGSRYNLNVSISGGGNDVKAGGFIMLSEKSPEFDIQVDFAPLNLEMIQYLQPEIINQSEGILTGIVELSGRGNHPEIDANLGLKDVLINPVQTGTGYSIGSQDLAINSSRVEFRDFKLSDMNENDLNIDGDINLDSIQRPSFDLTLNSNNFVFINTSEALNETFYGKLAASLNLEIKGTTTEPLVDGNANLENSTSLHYVLPQTRTATASSEGLVEFVKRDTAGQDILFMTKEDTATTTRSIRGLQLNTNISSSPDATMEIIVSPSKGEKLTVQGSSDLSFSLNPDGTTNLTGRYNISSGKYQLVLSELIKREFDIQEDSYLIWSGKPSEAEASITASYAVYTSPRELVTGQMTGGTTQNDEELAEMKKFLVVLNVEGDIMSPSIDFKIEAAPGESTAVIDNRLAQLNQNESEVNKQVFSLLIFKRFMYQGFSQAPSTAYTIRQTARKNVSSLLSEQFNRFSNQYIEGVDLNLDVRSYQAAETGQNEESPASKGVTNVNLQMSRQFFSDRLLVEVGGSIGIEDNYEIRQEDLNSIAGDIIVEYKITPEGNYRIRGFNQTTYDDLLYGEINQTGIGFIINRDFRRFKYLFSGEEEKENK
ncbi:MAG: translocation/assembly module TamB domain-containing protein [Bacteroidota bacterium]